MLIRCYYRQIWQCTKHLVWHFQFSFLWIVYYQLFAHTVWNNHSTCIQSKLLFFYLYIDIKLWILKKKHLSWIKLIVPIMPNYTTLTTVRESGTTFKGHERFPCSYHNIKIVRKFICSSSEIRIPDTSACPVAYIWEGVRYLKPQETWKILFAVFDVYL